MCGVRETGENMLLVGTKVVVTGYLTLITIGLGLLGNILSIVTLLHRNMVGTVFTKLLVALCCADLMVISTGLVTTAKIFYPQSGRLQWLAPWSDSLCHVSLSASVFLVVSITVERYQAVVHPHQYHARPRHSQCCILSSYLTPVIIAAIILNLPKILNISGVLKTLVSDTNTVMRVGIMYQIFHPTSTTCIIPLIIIIVINIKIVQRSQRMTTSSTNRHQYDLTMAKIMMAVVIVFIVLHSPKMLMALYEVN